MGGREKVDTLISFVPDKVCRLLAFLGFMGALHRAENLICWQVVIK